MSLICIRNNESIYEKYKGEKFITFCSTPEIQEEFCRLIELEQSKASFSFLKNQEILHYMKLFGIEYTGNFRIRGDFYSCNEVVSEDENKKEKIKDMFFQEGYSQEKLHEILSNNELSYEKLSGQEKEDRKTTEFVTFLNYPMQLACIALAVNESVYVEDCSSVMYASYLKPVLEKKNIYWKVDQDDSDIIRDFIEHGCKVILDDESISEKYKERIKGDSFYRYLFMEEYFPKYISRELDAKVFDEDKVEKIFVPVKQSFESWLTFQNPSMLLCDYGTAKEILNNYPVLKKALYVENDKPDFHDCYRRPPIYMLWQIDGRWYFRHTNSFKWPCYIDILLQVVFSPEEWTNWDETELKKELSDEAKELLADKIMDNSFEADSVDTIFALVLNTDEICDAMEYWKYIAFYMKYDRRGNVIEICERNSAMIEFHRALQESVDFSKDAW